LKYNHVVVQQPGCGRQETLLSATRKIAVPHEFCLAYRRAERRLKVRGGASMAPERRLIPAGGCSNDPQDEAQRAGRHRLLRLPGRDRGWHAVSCGAAGPRTATKRATIHS